MSDDSRAFALSEEHEAPREAMFSYALSEPEAGSDAAAMKTRAARTDSATC